MEGRGGARGEAMAGRGVLGGFYEGIWKGVNGQHEGHFGVSNIFTKMQLYHGIQTSLFFLDQMLITTSMKLGQ